MSLEQLANRLFWHAEHARKAGYVKFAGELYSAACIVQDAATAKDENYLFPVTQLKS